MKREAWGTQGDEEIARIAGSAKIAEIESKTYREWTQVEEDQLDKLSQVEID